ncbi:hypothetical protein AM218_12175 [Hymenobacter sp. DG25A]|nr:hypothetical protein AM218_12175 [Hymenobacter sp. DG25A]
MSLKEADTEPKVRRPRVRQHTLLTYWPKYGAPVMFLLAIIATALMVQWGKLPSEVSIPVILFLSLLLIFSVVLSYLFHYVYLTDEELVVKRYSQEVFYPRAAIKSIHCIFSILYAIETSDGQRRLFLPRLSQVHKDIFNF